MADHDSIRRFEDESNDGSDRPGPLSGLSATASNMADVPYLLKEKISNKYTEGEELVEVLLTGTWWGAIIDELFFAGNMPILHEYLCKYSFLGDSPLSEVGTTLWGKVHYITISILLLVTVLLRGISQVYLCNNPFTGILICVGLYLTDPKLLIYAIVGTVSATTGAFVLCLPSSMEILSGLTGYDGALIGCAVFTFISPDDASSPEHGDFMGSFRSKGMAITVVLATLAGFLHMSARHSSDLPALTLSFNICMMGFLLSLTDNRSRLTALAWVPWEDDFSADDAVGEYWISANLRYFHDATARGVGQFMFVSNTVGAWMVILGIAITSRTASLAAVMGSFVASLSARYIFLVPPHSLVAVRDGLYGYSAAGVCAAIGGGVFYHASLVSLVLGILGAVLAVFIQLAVEAILINDNLSLPSLTIPFVLTTWIIMLSRSAWLDPKTEGSEDMDDVLFKNKDRKRKKHNKGPLKPDKDDPNESWNTRDRSQMERRDSVRAALSKPFAPIIRKMSSNKLLNSENSKRGLMNLNSPPEKKGMGSVTPDERGSDDKHTSEGEVLKSRPIDEVSGHYFSRYQPPPKDRADGRKIAVTELEDF